MNLFFRLILLVFIWLAGAWIVSKFNIIAFTQTPQSPFFTTLVLWFYFSSLFPVAIVFMILAYRKRRVWFFPFVIGMLFTYLFIYSLQAFFVHNFPISLNWLWGEQSFLSMPAATSVFLFFYLSKESQISKWVFLLLSLLTAFSLIYLGIYFPLDVWHGFMIAFLFLNIMFAVMQQRNLFLIFQNTLVESFLLNFVGVITTSYVLFFSNSLNMFLAKPPVFLFWIFFIYFFIRLFLELFILAKRIRTLYVSKAQI